MNLLDALNGLAIPLLKSVQHNQPLTKNGLVGVTLRHWQVTYEGRYGNQIKAITYVASSQHSTNCVS